MPVCNTVRTFLSGESVIKVAGADVVISWSVGVDKHGNMAVCAHNKRRLAAGPMFLMQEDEVAAYIMDEVNGHIDRAMNRFRRKAALN